MIRVWIADDHTLFAQGLSRGLDAIPDIRVVGIAASGAELLEGIQSQPAEVCITDLEMPGGGGKAVLEGLKDTPVIVVSMHADDEQKEAARAAGASGLLFQVCPTQGDSQRRAGGGRGRNARRGRINGQFGSHRAPQPAGA